MAKTEKELTALKQQYENLTAKLRELSEDELSYVSGGAEWYGIDNGNGKFEEGSRLVP